MIPITYDSRMKACPECGSGRVDIIAGDFNGTFLSYGLCWKCKHRGPMGKTSAEAAATWNTPTWRGYFQAQIDAGRPISEIKLWRKEWERNEINEVIKCQSQE